MQTVVEQIKDRLPITDVLSSYITLIPAGNQYKAKCPFHNERTASFSISPDRGLYYCFGCGAKGDIFTFVQQFEGVDFGGALKMLAERAGVEISKRNERSDDRAPLYELLEKTTQRFQNELQKNNEALQYLKGRGITPETISQFRLGYAPAEWRFVASACKSDTEREIAERVGLIKKKEEGKGTSDYYDRFRGRIMFPIGDSSGRIIGFSGRMFPDTDEGPKYLNSPETELFQKSRVLYGLDKAKFHIKKAQFAILVEGQMDLLMSHQAGFKNTVATSGTAVSEQSLEEAGAALVVLSRLAPHLFIAFDGDTAGKKALSRAALVALMLGMNPKVVAVPEGLDPADFLLNEGPEKWKALLAASKHFITHQAQAIRIESPSPHMLVRSLREHVFPYLSKVASPIEQKLYIEAIGRELDIEAEEVKREHARFVASQPVTSQESDPSAYPLQQSELLLPGERLAAFVERFPSEEACSLLDETKQLAFGSHAISSIEVADDRKALAYSIIERDYGLLAETDRSRIVHELAEKTKAKFFDSLRMSLAAELRRAEAAGDESSTKELLAQLAELNKRRHPVDGT